MSVQFPSVGYSIVHRQSSIMLAHLSGQHAPLTISNADILLLEAVLSQPEDNQAIADFLANALVSKLAGNVNENQVRQRLSQLQQPLNLKFQLDGSDIQSLQSVHVDQGSYASMAQMSFYLSMHHCVYLSDQGLVSYSTVLENLVKLSGLETLLLFAFCNGSTPENVLQEFTALGLDADSLSHSLARLVKVGLVVTKEVVVSPKEENLTPFNVSTEGAEQEVLDWRRLEPDGRIPVYFVPHMENHFPLALGVLLNALKSYNDGELLESFVLLPINFLEPSDLLNGPYRKFGTGVWLFSNYMWSIDLNMQISNAVKQHNPFNFTVHGGPSTPDYQGACEEFLKENPSVDIAVHGEGEVTITEIFATLERLRDGRVGFDQFAMSKVNGLTFRDTLTNKMVRTQSRERMRDPGSIPSPYLSGVFDNYQGRVEAAIIETNRGCPYGCTFCDWGSATNQKIRKFDLERVFDEITWIGRNKVKVLWIADANYGMYERDIEVSRHIVETKQKYGYPQEVVVNYTKNTNKRLVEIIKVFCDGGIISQGIISIQTSDESTLEVINRKNIRTERYDELAGIFAEQQLPLSTDLMIGLPGITVEAFMQDLQRYIDMDVSVKAYPTQLLPNSPMADPDYVEKYKIKVDAHNFLISTYSYTEEELEWMKAVFQAYTMADGYGLLRYVVRFLQWEYKIQALDFLQDLMRDVDQSPTDYPLLTWAVKFFNQDKSMPGGWQAFYQELADYLVARHGVKRDSALSVILSVSRACMPDDALNYPYTLPIEHDFVAYFAKAKSDFSPLASFAPGSFQVSDPNKLVSIDLNASQYDSHQYFWHLQSPVARASSIVKTASEGQESLAVEVS